MAKKENDPNVMLKTGLWAKIGKKSGQKYYSALVEIKGLKYWVNIFKQDKKSEKHPDLELVISKAGEKPSGKPAASQGADKDDIPF